MDVRLLIQRYLADELSEPELLELEASLRSDAALRRDYLREVATETALREAALEREAEPAPPSSLLRSRSLWMAAAAVGTVLAIALVVLVSRPSLAPAEAVFIATLVSSENAAWESALPTTPGSRLTAGDLKLKLGLATVKFHSGAEIVLEAPAELRLLSPMRARLKQGVALVEVTEEARGFVLETPDGYAVDYGTRFAVQVDSARERSQFELIEGEISVHHPGTGEEMRLAQPHQAVAVSGETLQVIADTDEGLRDRKADVMRVGTAGRSDSVIRNNKRRKYMDAEVLSVKTTELQKWDSRSFFAFDLSVVDLGAVSNVRLRLNLVPSRRGFASRLPQISRFAIYGLTNREKADWQIGGTWEESPGPEDGVRLGTFEIPRSRQRGAFGISGPDLLEFLREHTGEGGPVTFILVRETMQIEGDVPGLTHMFASDSHPESVGPMLEFTTSHSTED